MYLTNMFRDLPHWSSFVALSLFLCSTEAASAHQRATTCLHRHCRHNDDAPRSCGSGWQENYRRLHAPVASLLATTPPDQWQKELEKRQMRIAVDLVREGKYHGALSGGVGDRFTGLITMFALSLLNDVPFFIDYTRLFDAFVSGYGQLTWNVSLEEYINYAGYNNVHIIFPFWTQVDFIRRFKKKDPFRYKELYTQFASDMDTINHRGKFNKRNMLRAEYMLNTRTISVVRAAAGFITTLFRDGKYVDRLRQWGLNRENIYGCLFDYLFQPNIALKEEFRYEMETLSNPNILKILVQIRSGDAQIGTAVNPKTFASQPSALLNLTHLFFDCATQLERAHGEFYDNVTWYLMTDSYNIYYYNLIYVVLELRFLVHCTTITDNYTGSQFRGFVITLTLYMPSDNIVVAATTIWRLLGQESHAISSMNE